MNRELTAVYFMWKREMTRFFRSRSRILGSLGFPFFFLAVLGTGLNGAISLPGMQGDYLGFIAPGVLGMVLLTGSIFSGIIVIMDRQFGFLKETLIAPVSRLSIVVGKSLGGMTTAVIQGLIMLLIAMLLGVQVEWSNILPAVLLMAAISLSFVSLGIAIASVIEDIHGFQLLMNFFVFPMFFLSGALFPINNAPPLVRFFSYIDPLTYGVDGLRFLLSGHSSLPIAASVTVVLAFFALATFLAAYLFSKIEG